MKEKMIKFMNRPYTITEGLAFILAGMALICILGLPHITRMPLAIVSFISLGLGVLSISFAPYLKRNDYIFYFIMGVACTVWAASFSQSPVTIVRQVIGVLGLVTGSYLITLGFSSEPFDKRIKRGAMIALISSCLLAKEIIGHILVL